MRRYLLLVIFVLCLCFASGAEARKLALLVGVDDYENVSPLKCCVNDIKALKEALINIGFEKRDILILTTGGSVRELPTKNKIEQKVAEILALAQPDDLVFFAFSGHGMREDKTDYFCPPYADAANIKGTCVSITKIMDDLSKCQARFKWMVVDACRDYPNSSRDGRAFQVIPAPPAGVALFQSCDRGEMSYEEKRSGGNGYFTKNLVAALSGEADSNQDGKLTLFEVCTWTSSQTEAEVRTKENKSQRPYLNLSASDFTLSENVNCQKAKALVEEARKAMDDEEYVLAVQKYDEAIALCPQNKLWIRERNLVIKLIKRPAIVDPPSDDPNSSHSEFPKAGDRETFTVNGVEFAFRYCPPGAFVMGSPLSEVGHWDNETQHQVTFSKGFWMMETEVTQKQWVAVMGYNPSKFHGDNLPVEAVSWNDCQNFCWKCAQLGLPVQLPTEAQWEYACRAGSSTAFFWGNALNGDRANCDGRYPCGTSIQGNYVARTTPFGSYTCNAWGLYDMHGNAWEWCEDWYGEYSQWSQTDPVGPATGSLRIIRGGGWDGAARRCRSANRSYAPPSNRDVGVGFRCVKGQ